MKSNQRLDYHRLAEALVESGLVSPDTMQHVYSQCQGSYSLLCEMLVREGTLSEWDLSRLCCEVFALPFLPVEVYAPNTQALEGLDPAYLRHFGLVPLDRYGKLLTVVMPGIVPSEVLEGLSSEEGVRVVPVVGTPQTNREWLAKNLPDLAATAAPSVDDPGAALPVTELSSLDENDWSGIFDAGDEAVQFELRVQADDETDA